MDKLRLFTGGFPGTTKTFDFLQSAYTNAIGALTALGGDSYIIKGLQRNGTNIAAGAIVYNGEYLPFVTGPFSQTVSIYEDVEEVPYNEDSDNDGNLDLKPAYVTRYAKCGDDGIETFDFSELKTLTPLSQQSTPIGGIIMWSGTTIPQGWHLCDGSNGTPNLTNKFIVGAGDNYTIGQRGGRDTVTLTTDQMPSHSHQGVTDNKGEHRHTGSTNTTGSHTHSVPNETGPDGGNGVHFTIQGNNRTRQQGRAAGSHSHTVSTNNAGMHNHNFVTSFVGNNKDHENRPPYYALAFIQYQGQ
ncbi:tail fiber protein [Aquimarina latercula]|uniref:tail fiber protein n=1 Tax=Aquimarina latercula TaxID=987 RepID=UPI00040F7EAA|nr:tail fiber protein [Aquimarina latercula]